MRHLLVILFSLVVVFGNAQEFTIKQTQEFAFKDFAGARDNGQDYTEEILKIGNYYYRKEIHTPGIKFYTVRLKNVLHGLAMHKYDADMKEVAKEELEDGKKEFGPLGENLIAFRDKLIMLYYKFDNDDSVSLFVSEIDANSLKLKNPKIVYKYNQKNIGLFGMITNAHLSLSKKLLSALSPDSSKLLIVTGGNEGEMYSVVLDKDLNLIKGYTTFIPRGNEFSVNDIFIDNTGNRYATFSVKQEKKDKYFTRGVYVRNTNDVESYVNLVTGSETVRPNELYLNNSNDLSKVYLYSDYTNEHLSEGILMGSVDAIGLSIKEIKTYPYPDDFKKRIYKLGYGDKSHGNYSVINTKFRFNELGNGSIALSGYPIKKLLQTYTNSHVNSEGAIINDGVGSRIKVYAGPIVVAFISQGNGNFTMIPRDQSQSEASDCLTIPYKNDLLCIYTDKEKNINRELTDDVSDGGSPSDYKLAAATISSDGKIINRKKIGEDPKGSNYYFLSEYQQITPYQFIIPIGRDRINLIHFFKEKVQMAELVVSG